MSDGSSCDDQGVAEVSDCVDCGKGHCDRWDHLMIAVMTHHCVRCADRTACDANGCRGVWTTVTVGDEVPRCACGGMFHPAPSGDGTMLCDCCGAAWDYEFGGPKSLANVPENEVGRTLTEVLLARRRPSTTWSPTDDDVKVTVHA